MWYRHTSDRQRGTVKKCSRPSGLLVRLWRRLRCSLLVWNDQSSLLAPRVAANDFARGSNQTTALVPCPVNCFHSTPGDSPGGKPETVHNVRVTFLNDAGERLAGILDLPASVPRAFALFAHCFTCGKNLKSAANISSAMAAADIAVLRFDFTGLGQSEGDFSDSSFSSNVGDLVAAARFLQKEYESPALLVGHSLGGTAVLQAASRIPSAVAVATIGSPASPEHVVKLFGDARDDIETRGFAKYIWRADRSPSAASSSTTCGNMIWRTPLRDCAKRC